MEEKTGDARRGAERLRGYEVALRLARQVEGLAAVVRCSRGRRDQFQRSADSALLNTAEGAGHFQPRKKIYHYEVAKGSVEECRAAMRLLEGRNPQVDFRPAHATANMLCKLLVALIKAQEKRL